MPKYRGNLGRDASSLLFVAVSVLFLSGCAGNDEAPVLTTTPISPPHPPAGELGNPGRAGALSALSVTRDAAAERRYTLTSASKPALVHLVRVFRGSGAENWMLGAANTDAGGRIEPGSVEGLRFELGAAGEVCLCATTDTTEKVLTEFEPPLRVLPATLMPGEAVSQSLTMIVRPLSKPDTIQNKGPATQEVTHMGMEHITVPAGEFDAHHVRTVLKGTLDTARLTITTDTWFAPPAGIVAETTVQRVTVLGIAVRSSATKLELVSAAPGSAPVPEPVFTGRK